MIGDLWVLVTRLEAPRRDGVPVTEPQLLALTARADSTVDDGHDTDGHGDHGRQGDRGPAERREHELSPREHELSPDMRDDENNGTAARRRSAEHGSGAAAAPGRGDGGSGMHQVDGLIPVDRVEWDAWRTAADRYLAALRSASSALAAAERRAGRAAARLLPGARRRATVAAEAGFAIAAAEYVATLRTATSAYWPIHCEIGRRLESQSAARRWLEIRTRFAGHGTEQVWGWSLRELDPAHTPGVVELTVFRWDSIPSDAPSNAPARAADFVSPDRFGAQDLDRELLRLRAQWTVRRIVWDEPAQRRVEQETDGVPFALWWRAVTARVDADEKVVPPRSAQAFTGPPAASGARRRIEVLQLPEQTGGEL